MHSEFLESQASETQSLAEMLKL